MIRTLLTKLLLLACVVLTAAQMDAQGWIKKYSPDAVMAINAIVPAGSAYYATGWNVGAANSTFQRVIKVDENGSIIWKSDLDSLQSATVANTNAYNGVIIFGTGPSRTGSGLTHSNLMYVDSNGQRVWMQTLHPERPLITGNANADIDTTDDKGYIITYTALDTLPGSTVNIYLTRVDFAGQILWEKTYYTSYVLPVVYSVRNSKDGGFVVTAGANSQAGAFAFKVNDIGNLLWTYTPTASTSLTSTMSKDGNVLLVGSTIGGGPSYITKVSQTGTQLWSKSYTLPDSAGWDRVIERADGNLTVLGATTDSRHKFAISVADTLGHVLSYSRVSIPTLGTNVTALAMGYKAMTAANDGGFIFGGWLQNDPANYTGLLIKTDSTGLIAQSFLSGRVFGDVNNNCLHDANEIYLPNVGVTITGAHDTLTAYTEDSGYFSIGANAGSYNLQEASSFPYWRPSSCDPASITLAAGDDSVISLGLMPVVIAPYITINGYISRPRLCLPATYTAQYCNIGTAAFTGQIVLTIDTMLQVDSASTPWLSQAGNVYTFQAQPLGIMQCATLSIYCTVHCYPGLQNRTACIDAQAIEDTILNAPPQWDGSNLRMTANYNTATDSITFTLKNRGTGNMSGTQGLMVIEDNVILMTTPMQLPAGAQATQVVKANGATWRATIPQTAYNPYSTFATAAIEAAGTNQQGSVSHGFLLQYPYNGYTSYEYNTCEQILNSHDPNSKTASPTGAGTSHLIDTNVVPEYTIEFQNTGTDTAFTVVVVDTLPRFLDPATIVQEISSAPCTMALTGRNVLTFTFNHINLPDSNVNVPKSMGYVKFRVHQKHGNAIGTVINNTVNIYFDYNDAVTTNTARLRIGHVLITGIQNIYADKPVKISAYPNPFAASTTIKVDGENFSDLALSIYDISGKMIRHYDAKNGNSFTIDHAGLSTGEYIFQMTGNGKPVGSGKIIAE